MHSCELIPLSFQENLQLEALRFYPLLRLYLVSDTPSIEQISRYQQPTF